MALDVNGYNSVFKSFVDFAQERIGFPQRHIRRVMLSWS